MKQRITMPSKLGHLHSDTGAIVDDSLDSGMTLEDAALSVVMDTKIRSENAYRERKTSFNDYLMHYLNRPRERTGSPYSASLNNIPVPVSTEAVDAVLAFMMNRILQSESLCHIRYTSEEDKDISWLVERKLIYDNHVWDSMESYYSLCKMGALFGSSPARTEYVEKRQKVRMPEGIGNAPERVVAQGVRIAPIDLFDLFPSPEKRKINDENPVIVRSFQNWEDLKANEERLKYFDLDLIEHKRLAIPIDQQELRHQRRSLLKVDNPMDMRPDSIEVLEWEGRFPVSGEKDKDGEYIYEPAVITVANGTLIGMRRNDSITGDNNLVMGKLDWIPGSFWGIGVIEKLHPQQHQANTLLDMILDNLAMSVNNMWLAVEDAVAKPYQLYSRPNGLVEIKRQYAGQLRGVFDLMETKPLPGQVFEFYKEAINRGEMSSGATEISKGGGRSSVETATESNILQNWSANRLDLYLRLFEFTLVRPETEHRAQINIDLVSPDFIEKIFPKKGQVWAEAQSRSGFVSQPDYIAVASTKEADERLQIQQAQQLMEIAKGHPALEPLMLYAGEKTVDAYKWPDKDLVRKLLTYGWKYYVQLTNAKMQGQAPEAPVNAGGGASVTAPMTGGNGNPNQQGFGQTSSRPQGISSSVNPESRARAQAQLGRIGK